MRSSAGAGNGCATWLLVLPSLCVRATAFRRRSTVHEFVRMATGAARGRMTPFQERCFALVRSIPEGKVSTYGGVAAALAGTAGTSARSGCARAVGQAMRHNPLAPSTGCDDPVP